MQHPIVAFPARLCESGIFGVHRMPSAGHLRVRITHALLLLCLSLHAEEKLSFLSAPIGFAKMRMEVEKLGFPSLSAPVKLVKGEVPARSKEGRFQASGLELVYEPDGTKPAPKELTFKLDGEEVASAARLLAPLVGDKEGETEGINRKAGTLKVSGLSALKLVDLQFVRPLGGAKKNFKPLRIAFTALTAERVALLQAQDGQTKEVLAVSNVVLGGDYRQMEVKTKKDKVKLNKKNRIVRMTMKRRDPKRKSASLAIQRPESGELPTPFITSLGHRRNYYIIVPKHERTNSLADRHLKQEWLFLSKDGKKHEELILPSQFDSKGALGVFLRILDHKKEPFHPRTREAKIEVVLVEVRFE